jgi:hypothetical protein
MIHSRHAAERALGLAMRAAVGYMHFRISHVHFHHRLAATLADPATARRGAARAPTASCVARFPVNGASLDV